MNSRKPEDMDKNVMAQLLVPVMGQQQFDAVSYVHDLVTAAASDGRVVGATEGYQSGFDEGYRQGANAGRASGDEEEAFKAGWQFGFNAGVKEGGNVSAVDVYQAGYDAGHVAGWDACVDDMSDEDVVEAVKRLATLN